MWREGLGCLKIIAEGKKGYSNHPATLEFAQCPSALYDRLHKVRAEMLRRGYKPKELPRYLFISPRREHVREWQTLAEQVERLRQKQCKCDLSKF